jgi:hypothetical protein
MDFVHLPEFPARIAAALRNDAAWPTDLTGDEQRAIDIHGMLPIVYRESLAPALREQAIRAAALDPLLLAGLQRVLAALRARGVQPLVLKGAALAYTIYPAPELRPRSDTDLLIAEDDLDAARDAFRSAGFREILTSGDDLGVRQRMFHRLDYLGVPHTFDVHLDITNNATTADALRYDELLQRAMPLPAIGEGALGLSLVDALIYACIHRVVHHHDSDRAIWLYDVYLIRARLTSAEVHELWERAAERRVVVICRHTLAAAQAWFGGAGDDAAAYLERLDDHEPSAGFLDRDRSRAAQLAGDLAALPTWRLRARRLRQLAFPPRAFMRQRFGVHTTAALPLLYVWRAVRGFARLFRRVT